jgi:cell division transport system permease protein
MAPKIDYFLKETAQALRRNGLVAFAAVSTAFIALFLLGGALLVQREADLLIRQTSGGVEVSVFLREDISPSQQTQIGDLLNEMPEVSSVRYESKAQAYQNFVETFREQEALVKNVSADALPASFRVKLFDPEDFQIIGARLTGLQGIETIVDHSAFLKRLSIVIGLFRWGVTGVSLVMLVAAAVLIGNTVRMGVFARRKEIGIMRLVGATNWFIRVPFMIEGILEGLLGAGAALLALFVLKGVFIDPLRNEVQFLPLVGTSDVMFTAPFLLIGGVLVATLASLIAMRRFLEV